ncbi:MAG TPA: transglutaminase family protein [Opitutae bacterium]|nr:transglutaminase [Puniceicoccaceae bacterium]HBR93240.1 transglutaminase family protein [Opitutae bacterium]|tara:strand:- start:511 stop:1401 length:891 start_codon:yes stop_codon:yes gene_type:complete
MKLSIQHHTTHSYERAVSFSDHALFLRPLDSHLRHVVRFEVATTPASQQRWVRDAYGNLVLRCNFGLLESQQLSFNTSIVIEVGEDNPFDFILESYATAYPFSYREPDLTALRPYVNAQAPKGAGRVLDWFYQAVPSPMQHVDVVQFLSDLNAAVARDINYLRRDEEGIQDPDTTLALRTGSCRDMAVLFIAITRQLGFAARFCSGYLYDPPVAGEDAHVFNRAVGSMHAWAEIYLPGAGWKGFDPTNGILANGFFIPCAVSHEPKAVDPIQGSYFANASVASTMDVSLEIEGMDQ